MLVCVSSGYTLRVDGQVDMKYADNNYINNAK